MNRTIPAPRLGFQFRLWHTWTAITGLAVIFALTAPMIRSLSSVQWQRLGIAGIALIAGVLLGYAFYSSFWRITSFQAGPSSFVMKNLTPFPYPIIRWFACLIGPAGVFFSVHLAVQVTTAGWFLVFMSFCAGVNLLQLVIAQSGNTIWLTPRGVNFGWNFYPWACISMLQQAGNEEVRFEIKGWKFHAAGSNSACTFFATRCAEAKTA